MTVTRIAQHEVDTAEPLESVRTAAQRMASRSVGMLLVLDARRRPVGVLTDRDIALRCVSEGRDPNQTTVAEIMSRSPRTVTEHASIQDALAHMRAHSVRRLPIVAADGSLAGVVALDDILALISDELWQMGCVVRDTAPSAMSRT
jgi:CBS domain-containing protein